MTFSRLILFVLIISLTSCFNDSDDKPVGQNEIKNFIYKGLNAAYLYKDNIQDFKPNKSNNGDYEDYLDGFPNPDAFFEHLIYKRETIDRFSWLTDDYIELEKYFQGESLSSGLDFRLIYFPEDSDTVIGYVRYVATGSTAEAAGVKRGDIFTAVNGIKITANNYRDLLITPNNFTINLADYTNGNVTPNNKSISVSKTNFTEDPVYNSKTLNSDGNKIGYLMYNGFTGTDAFDKKLNASFGQFKSDGITDLVLDLRYNSGGSVRTAIWLCSMITGQFTGEILLKQQWNNELQAQFEKDDPQGLIYTFETTMVKRKTNGDVYFNEKINHLNLNRLYVLTSKNTASASELIINGLNPYINVIQIGDVTTGKYQASITLYDSEDFTKRKVNPKHTYAMQPLIFKSLNKNGVTDYFDGLTPNTEIKEEFFNLGKLGDENEPLLAEALSQITTGFTFNKKTTKDFPEVGTNKDGIPFSNDMYIDILDLKLKKLK